MALQTLSAYKAWASITSVDATRDAALTLLLAEVEAAILKKIGIPIESATYTQYVDAPPRETLRLRFTPVTAITSVKYAAGSNGDPSLFTTDTLLTQYDDWILKVDQPDGTTSKCGLLVRTNGVWGARWRAEPGNLAAQLRDDPAAVQVVYTAGYASVPADLVLAANLATAKLFRMTRLGAQPQSASLNGASYSLPSAAQMQGVLGEPTIKDILDKYGTGGYYFG